MNLLNQKKTTNIREDYTRSTVLSRTLLRPWVKWSLLVQTVIRKKLFSNIGLEELCLFALEQTIITHCILLESKFDTVDAQHYQNL